jgi:hypothetical protein
MKEQARLGVRFHTVILADGTELPLQTETIVREGESPAQASAAKIGGLGDWRAPSSAPSSAAARARPSAVPSAPAAATAGNGQRPESRRRFAAGSPVTAKVLSPVTVTVEKE